MSTDINTHCCVMTSEKNIYYVALNESSCIGTKMLISYTENSTVQAIMLGPDTEVLFEDLVHLYPKHSYVNAYKSNQSKNLVEKLENYIINPKQSHSDFSLKIEGTDFQKLVWSELCKIPYGSLCSYADVARKIGRPNSVRAVANACGKNNIPIIIPCHRVIRSDGKYGGYSSGQDIKEMLIGIELRILNVKNQ